MVPHKSNDYSTNNNVDKRQ